MPWCAHAVGRNIELNGFEHAQIRAEAVGAADGSARLLVVGEASWSHLESTGRHADVRDEIDVTVVSIDSLVAAGTIPPPDVMKIDTEGAELQAIEGARATIARHRPAIVCELHDTNAAFVALMDELGYETSNLDGPAEVVDAGPGPRARAAARLDGAQAASPPGPGTKPECGGRGRRGAASRGRRGASGSRGRSWTTSASGRGRGRRPRCRARPAPRAPRNVSEQIGSRRRGSSVTRGVVMAGGGGCGSSCLWSPDGVW